MLAPSTASHAADGAGFELIGFQLTAVGSVPVKYTRT